MKLLDNLSYNWAIAFEAIAQNKIRSILTSLGIICGTASVIGMLAIGTGAKSEILEKMKILGTNNIIINSQFNEEDNTQEEEGEETEDEKDEQAKKRYSPGLTMEDAQSIIDKIPGLKIASPTITQEYTAYHAPFKVKSQLVGITSNYKAVNDMSIEKGRDFTKFDFENAKQVVLIGSGIAKKLFPGENPINQKIKVGGLWFTVVGIAGKREFSEGSLEGLGLRNFNNDIYVPISTVLMRIKNTSLITKKDLERGFLRNDKKVNYHQLNKIVIQVDDTKQMVKYAEIINRLLLRRHNSVEDFEIVVPEVLLKQEQETTKIFNFVLSVIASISLLVGGIGIMNIMLASILERTREIGIRMAVGAKRKDIAEQFLFEAIAISITGGLLGVLAGIATSFTIEAFSGITTIVTLWSVILAFVVSISIGLIFGIFPARKAAQQNTIDLLRYE